MMINTHGSPYDLALPTQQHKQQETPSHVAPFPLHDPLVLISSFDAQERAALARLADSKQTLETKNLCMDKAQTGLNAVRNKATLLRKQVVELMSKLDKTLPTLDRLVVGESMLHLRKSDLMGLASRLGDSANEAMEAALGEDESLIATTAKIKQCIVDVSTQLKTCTATSTAIAELDRQIDGCQGQTLFFFHPSASKHLISNLVTNTAHTKKNGV